MNRIGYFSKNAYFYTAAALFAAVAFTPALAQQNSTYRGSIVTDWTSHHVNFSDAGTLMDAMMNGRREQWQRIVNDPRYQMQQIRHHADMNFNAQGNHGGPPSSPGPKKTEKPALHRDWAVQIAPAGYGVAAWAYPAKYSFNPAAAPSCTNDYVVYPVNANGSGTQANIVGVNNLYAGSCTSGSVPSALFAYKVGTGQVFNSPVLSLDGTKIAFVETITGGSRFHVLTIDQSGNSGCTANTSPCNGAAYDTPAVPGVNNSAVDTAITMSRGVTDTYSSPFVDYEDDVAYVGDDTGRLHKFTGVFYGTPTEVTTNGWPLTVTTGANSGLGLTSPVYDSNSGDIFVATQYTGAYNMTGTLYCINGAATTASFCSTSSIAVGTNISDGPIVDSTWEQVILTADNSGTTNMILFQTPVNFSSSVSVPYGAAGTYHYHGAFDNAYFTDVSTGHMYACGNLASAATPVLFRVGFSSSGVMNPSPDNGSFQLVTTGGSGPGVSCSPLTEFYNPTEGNDYLFLDVAYDGVGDCGDVACVMNFALPTSAPFTFPTAPYAAPLEENYDYSFSAIIIDNYSNAAGASQIYFGDLGAGMGVQVSQKTLN
jgi:hypothetical protein